MKRWLLAVSVALHGGLMLGAETALFREEALQDDEIMEYLKENEVGKGAVYERVDDGKQAYHYAQQVRREHSAHAEDGMQCDWHCRSRVVAVHVDEEGKEQWIDQGSVVGASAKLMQKIKATVAVTAPMCGIDPQSGKPVPAILIKNEYD